MWVYVQKSKIYWINASCLKERKKIVFFFERKNVRRWSTAVLLEIQQVQWRSWAVHWHWLGMSDQLAFHSELWLASVVSPSLIWFWNFHSLERYETEKWKICVVRGEALTWNVWPACIPFGLLLWLAFVASPSLWFGTFTHTLEERLEDTKRKKLLCGCERSYR